MFGNSHGVGDGRSCDIALSQLLTLYDGGKVGYHSNTTSITQLKQKVAAAAGEPEVTRDKLKLWRHIENQFPTLQPNSITQTFVDIYCQLSCHVPCVFWLGPGISYEMAL